MRFARSIAMAALLVPSVLVGCAPSDDPQMTVFADQLRSRGFTVVSQNWDDKTTSKVKTTGGRKKRLAARRSSRTMEIVIRVRGCDLQIERVEGAEADQDEVDWIKVNGHEQGIAMKRSPRADEVVAYLAANRTQYLCYQDAAS